MDFNLKKEIKSTMLNYYKTKSKKKIRFKYSKL